MTIEHIGTCVMYVPEHRCAPCGEKKKKSHHLRQEEPRRNEKGKYKKDKKRTGKSLQPDGSSSAPFFLISLPAYTFTHFSLSNDIWAVHRLFLKIEEYQGF